MTNSELNEYILHYLKADRTKSAIMLTAGWGTGKSYYIQNELIPFLEKEKGNHSCIVVSLYGLSDVDELSKSLYLETKMKILTKKTPRFAAGKVIVKTVAKGLTSLAGIDLSMSDKDLKKLYESVDLTGKLVIFEDIERSRLDILEVLGYTYNLVEQDAVKVLLVANEDAILKYHDSEPNKDGKTYKLPDEDTIAYLAAKEKTVSDTITYCGDIKSAISTLILSFNNKELSQFAAEDQINDIIAMMMLQKNYNLRTFLFACQKITDIYNKLGSVEKENVQTIFFSILSFSMQIKSGYCPEWEGNDSISPRLGSRKYPLYRFCYDYIRWQEFDIGKVQAAYDAQKKLRLYNRNGELTSDADLRTIFDYYEHSEKEVISALKNVEHRLDNSEDIPIYCYNKLAYSLVVCHSILGFDYIPCKCKMVSNMQQHGNKIDPEILFLNCFEFKDEEEKQRFLCFSKELQEAMRLSAHTMFGFSYDPNDIHLLYTDITKNEAQATNGHLFIGKFDLRRLTNMLFSCSPSQLNEWRSILLFIYRHSHKGDFLETDCEFMNKLMDNLTFIISNEGSSMDKILLLQINLLIENLQGFVNQMS